MYGNKNPYFRSKAPSSKFVFTTLFGEFYIKVFPLLNFTVKNKTWILFSCFPKSASFQVEGDLGKVRIKGCARCEKRNTAITSGYSN